MELEDDAVYQQYAYRRELRGDRVVRMVRDEPTDELEQIEQLTLAWVGPIHPRAAAIHAVTWRDGWLCIEVDDDRGPQLADAAASLADDDRERWSVAQIIGLADACAALRARGATPMLRAHDLVVGIDGRVRMRAPSAHVEGRAATRSGPMPWPPYLAMLSPESATGRAATSDVFSLASNLYFAITGRYPFARENVMSMLAAIILEPADPITTRTPGLDDVIARAMAKQPAERLDLPSFVAALRATVPDAAEYDQVVSDRIVAWRATQ